MWLPKFIKQILFNAQPTTSQCLEYMSRGGIRALRTRTPSLPKILIFGVVDETNLAIMVETEIDLDPQISKKLSQHLTTQARRYLQQEGLEIPT